MQKPSEIKTLTRRHWLTGFSILAAMVKAFPAAAGQRAQTGTHGLENYQDINPPEDVPDIFFSFGGDDASTFKLSDFKGKVILFNLWATWCPTCVLEMPSMDRLQDKLGGDDFMVLPISLDRGGSQVVIDFYEENNIKNLPIAIDNSLNVTRKINPRGLPFSLLLNRQGEAVGSSLGSEEWDSAHAQALIRSIINAS